MGVIRVVIAIGIASTTTTAAYAADPATLPCVMRETPAAHRAAIVESARLLVADAKTPREIPSASRNAVHTAAVSCQKRHGWSDEARAAAENNTVATLGLGPARAAVTAVGIDPDRVMAAGRSMPEEQREAVMQGSTEAINALFAALDRQGLSPSLGKNEKLAAASGALLALLSFLDDSRAAFEKG